MCKVSLLFGVCGLLAWPAGVHGQAPPVWAVRYDNGPNFNETAYLVKVDPAGNAHVTGQAARADGNGSDLATVKYDPNGLPLWTNRFDSSLAEEYPQSMALDGAGNVYIAGLVYEAGTNSLLVVKIGADGAAEWNFRLSTFPDGQGHQYSSGNAVVTDGAGNVYVVGQLVGETQHGGDFVVLKLDGAGNVVWRRAFSGPGVFADVARAVAVDGAGNVYVAGDSYRVPPGAPSGLHAAVVKYDGDGNLLWSAAYPGVVSFDRGTRAVAVDGAGNVFVGATIATNGSDFLVLKYDANGGLSWAATYDGLRGGGSDDLHYMNVDTDGSVVTAGFSTGLDNDIVTVKWGADGVRQWVARYASTSFVGDVPAGLGLDGVGNVFVGGYAAGGPSQADYVALRYNGQGVQEWAGRYDNGGNSELAFAMDIGPGGSVYVTGRTFGINNPDYLTVKFVATPTPGLPQIISAPQDRSVVIGAGPTNVTFSVVAGGPGPVFYQWRFSGRAIPGANNATYTISAVNAAHAGEYSVIVHNAAGEVITPEARLTVHRIPEVTYIFPFEETVAEGRSVNFSGGANGDGPLSYQWQHNGRDIPGANSLFLQLTMVSTNDAGEYRMIARNRHGEGFGSPARLNVMPRIPLDRWTWRNPVPHGSDLRAIAFGNGRFVAVGEGGAILSSLQGTNWINSSLEAIDFRQLAFGNGRFVGVGGNFSYTSIDGLQWSEHRIPLAADAFSANINSIAFGAGVFVTVGSSVRVSSDGIGWLTVTNPLPYLVDVTYGNGRFVAVGYGSPSYTSTNGVDWVEGSPRGFALENVAFGNGLFVGCYYNTVATSVDGLNWSAASVLTNNFLYGLVFAGGQFIGLGSYIVTSPDGSNWTRRLTAPEAFFQDAASGNGVTVVIGDNANLLKSSDGSTWEWISNATDGNLRGIAHGRNRFVVAGNQGKAWVSFDGVAWARYQTPKTNDLRAVVFARDRFVLVGEWGSLMSSADGLEWELYPLLTNDLYGVSFVNGRFIAVGDRGAIVVSTNGRAWQVMLRPSSSRLQGVAYGNGVYVVTGQSGNQARSFNGTNWVGFNYSNVGYIESLLYTNAIFLGVGSRGITFSPDGTNWSVRLNTSELEGILYVHGLYITAGAAGHLFTSTNGVDWVRRGSPATKSLRNIIYARGCVWAIGNNETILQSGQFRPYLSSTLPGTMTVRAEPGQTIYLEESFDLREWYTRAVRTLGASDTTSWTDPATFQPRNYYRALVPSP